MWLQRLSSQTQAILDNSSESVDNLSIMADKIGDIYSFTANNIAAIQGTVEISELKLLLHSYCLRKIILNIYHRFQCADDGWCG